MFVAAAVGKIAAGSRWSMQARNLGVPRGVANVLPWAEMVLGALLVAGVASPWPAIAAVAVLAAFTVWIVVHLVRDQHPPCACFGAVSVAPLSWRHVARNAALLALGLLALIP